MGRRADTRELDLYLDAQTGCCHGRLRVENDVFVGDMLKEQRCLCPGIRTALVSPHIVFFFERSFHRLSNVSNEAFEKIFHGRREPLPVFDQFQFECIDRPITATHPSRERETDDCSERSGKGVELTVLRDYFSTM